MAMISLEVEKFPLGICKSLELKSSQYKKLCFQRTIKIWLRKYFSSFSFGCIFKIALIHCTVPPEQAESSASVYELKNTQVFTMNQLGMMGKK